MRDRWLKGIKKIIKQQRAPSKAYYRRLLGLAEIGRVRLPQT
ncbi:hypothetical protein [Tritonibacter mobilis]|uniref:Transposase n=1 Tax=Phaeobacter inhibens TaxID=221822 RepID=A0A2I7KGM6_9RHOB|nr:hypothetical protein PhaeoP88_04433 [Phaeobacter inhibens]